MAQDLGKRNRTFRPEKQRPGKTLCPSTYALGCKADKPQAMCFIWYKTMCSIIFESRQTKICCLQITENGDLKQIDTSSFLPSTNKMLYEIYKDKDGNLWVSAFDIGKFHHRHTPTHRQKISFKSLTGTNQSPTGRSTYVWMTKENFGSIKKRYGLCFCDGTYLTHYSTWTTGKRHLIAYPIN